jgi:hypothetical protein
MDSALAAKLRVGLHKKGDVKIENTKKMVTNNRTCGFKWVLPMAILLSIY